MKRGIFIYLFCIATILYAQPFPQRIEKPSPDYYGGLYFGLNGLGRCYYETGYSASIYSRGNESKTFKLIDIGLMVGDFKNKNFLVAPKIG